MVLSYFFNLTMNHHFRTMTEEEPQIVGPWKRVKILGRGGFGQVTLWHNTNTNQDIGKKKHNFCVGTLMIHHLNNGLRSNTEWLEKMD